MGRDGEASLNWLTAVALSMLTVALVGGGCGEDDLALSATDPGTRFEVEVGDVFSVVLESNPSTGYRWELAEPVPRDVLRLTGDSDIPPEGDAVGAAGHQELSFEAVGDGSTFIQLWYVRAFDDPPEPADRAQFEVIVGSGVPDGIDDDEDGDRPQPAIPDDEAAITVEEVLATRPAREVVVRGLVFDDGSGLVLCDVLAESFPPQCPGERLTIVHPERIEQAVELASRDQVRWSDRPVIVAGVLTEAGFEVRLVAADG